MTVHYHVLLVHGCHIQFLELGQLVVDELVGDVVIGPANILQFSVEGQSITTFFLSTAATSSPLDLVILLTSLLTTSLSASENE